MEPTPGEQTPHTAPTYAQGKKSVAFLQGSSPQNRLPLDGTWINWTVEIVKMINPVVALTQTPPGTQGTSLLSCAG